MTVVYKGERTTIDPAATGARVDVNAAVSSALAATPRSAIAVPVRYSQAKAQKIVAKLAKRYDRAPVDAAVIGAAFYVMELADISVAPISPDRFVLPAPPETRDQIRKRLAEPPSAKAP